LGRIADHFEQADRNACRAQTIEEFADWEEERREYAGRLWAAEEELAQLTLLQLRIAFQHQPDALRQWLIAALRPEIEPIADATAINEQRLTAIEQRLASQKGRRS
jgi:hypothetical protein